MMDFVFKNDGFCTENDGIWTKTAPRNGTRPWRRRRSGIKSGAFHTVFLLFYAVFLLFYAVFLLFYAVFLLNMMNLIGRQR